MRSAQDSPSLPVATMLPPQPDPSFDRIARLVRKMVDVPTALVSLVDRQRQVMPGAVGLPEPWQSARQVPLSHSFCKHVVIEAAPLVISDATAVDPDHFSREAVADMGVVAYAGMPLTDLSGNVIGSLCAIDTTTHDWSADELADLADLAATCSSELQLREAAGASARRAQRLIATMPVGFLACDSAWTITAANAEAAQLLGTSVDELVDREFWNRFPATVGTELETVYRRVAATGVSEIVEFFQPAPVARWHDVRVQYDPPGVSVYFVDITDRREVQELLAQEAMRERTVAHTLQRALLTELPAVRGFEFAARYLTATGTEEVGGDWYDAVEQPDGAVTLSIGDVCGHGLEAAATMGQLRSMLRGFLWDTDLSLADTLTRLDRATRGLERLSLATLIAARITPATGAEPARVRWSNAGHLAPLLVDPDAAVQILTTEPDLMLGVRPGIERSEHSIALRPGSTLVLYTDGLVETRTANVLAGVDRLVEACARHAHRGLDEMLDRVLDELRVERRDDDVAVLVVRVGTPPQGTITLDQTLGAPGAARAYVGERLDGLSTELVGTAKLLTSELVTNAVVHGSGPVTLTVHRDVAAVTVSVHDRGTQLPTVAGFGDPYATNGRGLPIVGALSADWGIDTTTADVGKLVWFRLETPGGAR